MAVVDRIPLKLAYSMRIMTGDTRCFLVHNMFFVFTKAVIAQDTRSAMALITKCIALRVLHSEIGGLIVSFQ